MAVRLNKLAGVNVARSAEIGIKLEEVDAAGASGFRETRANEDDDCCDACGVFDAEGSHVGASASDMLLPVFSPWSTTSIASSSSTIELIVAREGNKCRLWRTELCAMWYGREREAVAQSLSRHTLT
jgi:hypothetical protein